MRHYLRTLRAFSHDVRMYLVTSALIGVSFFGIVAVLFNLYLLRLGYGPEFVGLVQGSAAFAFAAASVPAGAMGTRWGSRRMVITGVTVLTVGIALFPLTELMPPSLRSAWVIGSRLLVGMGFALYMVNAYPFLIAATRPAERDHVFSLQVAISPLAGFVGSLVGGMLPAYLASVLHASVNSPAPYRYSLFIAAVVMIPAVVAVLKTQAYEEEIQGSEQVPTDERPPLRLILIMGLVMILRNGGEGVARSFFNVYLDAGLGVSTARIGLLTALSQVLAGPVVMVAPAIVAQRGRVTTIVAGSLGSAAGLLILALLPFWYAAGVGFMLTVAMMSFTRGITTVYQMEVVPPAWRSRMAGITSMAMGTGFFSMAIGGGYLIAAVGYRGLFLTGAVLTVVSALIFWVYFRKPRGEYIKAYQPPPFFEG